MGGAATLGLGEGLRAAGLRGDVLAARAEHEGDLADPGLCDRGERMGEQRATGHLVQHLGPGGAHPRPLARRQDDGEAGPRRPRLEAFIVHGNLRLALACRIRHGRSKAKDRAGELGALQLKRREFLKLGLLELGLTGAAGSAVFPWVGPAAADAPKPPAPVAIPDIAGPIVKLAAPVDFEAGDVADVARALAKQPFKPISSDLPAPFKSLAVEQYAAIALKPDARIWANEKLGFSIAPMQRGFQTTNPIEINLVVAGKAYKLVYSTEMFDFGKLTPSASIGDIGFAGFHVLVPQGKSAEGKSGERELATFQGANFFRALAEGQVAGLMARALALKVADSNGEETPLFRTLWIEKPNVVDNLLLVHALIDSDSVVGAFRFTIRPGGATIIDTECTLVPARRHRQLRPRCDERDASARLPRPQALRRLPPQRRRGRRRADADGRK